MPPSKLIARFLWLVTLGGQRRYLTDYTTTLGCSIFLSSSWSRLSDESRYLVLRHEAVHLRQFRRFGWLGMPFLYVLPIFPVGLAVGRAWLEWEAYREGLVALAELRGVEAARHVRVREDIVRQFVGPAYGWMWPFPRQVRGWVDQVLGELEEVGPGPPERPQPNSDPDSGVSQC